jgi:hypothetical protein
MTFAHAVHWIESLGAVIPVVAIALWIGVVTLRDRTRKRRAQ